jgi:hypothetical protein
MYYRRTYLLLLFVRIYLALSPSYIHPDENFQGPEILAGKSYVFPFVVLGMCASCSHPFAHHMATSSQRALKLSAQ